MISSASQLTAHRSLLAAGGWRPAAPMINNSPSD